MDGIGKQPGIRPRSTIGRRLDATARACFPGACTLLLMLLTALPFGFSGQDELLPAVALCSVWFWSLFRPAAMPPPMVFVIGLMLDLLGYQPLGLGVFILLTVHGLAHWGRRFVVSRGFGLAWVAFAPVAALGSALTWILGSSLSLRLLPVGPAAFQAVVTVALYPTIGILFARAHRGVADPEQA